MRGNRRVREGLWLCGLVLAAVILLLPSFLDELSALCQADLIGRYESELDARSRNTLAKEREKAVQYNAKIRESQKAHAFSYSGDSAYDSDYLHLLGGSGGIMGYLEIPSVNLYMPVYHGTSADVLKQAAGHLYGTSLPVGGPGTHAVIAAHSGLQNAELFTNLTDIRKDDLFYMHVLGEMHAYRVTEINIVYPSEEDAYLQVEDGRDLITLYTCTPAGINDHRLLVRGSRTEDPPLELSGKTGERTALRRRKTIILLILIAAVPLLLFTIGFRRIKHGRETVRY